MRKSPALIPYNHAQRTPLALGAVEDVNSRPHTMNTLMRASPPRPLTSTILRNGPKSDSRKHAAISWRLGILHPANL